MKKALISRYGGYGDAIFCTPIPRLLKDQGFDVVDFEANHKTFQVLGNNPFIDNLIYFEPALVPQWTVEDYIGIKFQKVTISLSI